MTQSPIAAAVRLLRENAEELKQSHTLAGLAEWPACEDEVKAVYDEQIAVAAALEAMLNQHHAQEAQPVTVDVPASGATALSEYLKTCEQQAIVPDVGGAFASAFIAGFNLAASKAARGAVAEQALLKVLHAVQHYLPPDGVSARDTLTTIIEVVDPWPLDQAPSAVPAPDERAAFEHFMRIDTSGFTLERHDDGNYKEFEVATYWHFWQARAALAATPAAAAPVVLPEPVGPIVEKLLALARILNTAVEDWGESSEDNSMDVKFHSDVVTEMDAILDYFDSLPDGPDENVIESGPAKAARILRAMLAGVSAPAALAVERGEVLVTVSGFTGSGKSAIAGEIEIMCRALGLQVEWPDSDSEKHMTHADWIAALEQYKPRVRIVECNVPHSVVKGQDK
ncbi:hypothetical protein LZ683_08585 [Comamonas testosteroni]|uniref:hypothetical protein n=1 Tax=Comamonas testosteroni TaxID=285 RepID=UPI0023AAB3BE|nr:hypothetical protein [Comamonas testosteroni]WEE79397.1 hypothetical protein LZ683_08585 [Comamonas testosteroni]